MPKPLRWFLPLLFGAVLLAPTTKAAPTPTVITACTDIAVFADDYLAAYADLMLRVDDHAALYEQDPAALSPADIRTIRDDFALLAADLTALTPPPALYQQWAAEIAYWHLFALYAEAAAAIDPTWAANAYGLVVTMASEAITVATQYATASCPVWQDTVDTVQAMTAAPET